MRTSKPAPAKCVVCGAPASRTVGTRPACEQCAEPLHQAAIQKRDALVVALRQLSGTQKQNEEAAV